MIKSFFDIIKNKAFVYFSAILVITLVLQLPDLKSFFTLDRLAFEEGQYWRVLTGNIVHTNLVHWAMNLSALFLVFSIFKPKLLEFEIIGSLLCLFVGFSILYWTEIAIYSGLSGVIHGLFGYYTIKEILLKKADLISLLMFILLIAKIVYEQNFGSSQQTTEMIGAMVAIDSHLYGAISGVVISLLTVFIKSRLK